jgi:hypothetical protein
MPPVLRFTIGQASPPHCAIRVQLSQHASSAKTRAALGCKPFAPQQAKSTGGTKEGPDNGISARRRHRRAVSGNKKAGSEKIRLSLLEVPIKAKPPEGNTPRR